jgi:FKBP-type peptidyl-prolyl cis-trans isomerase SlpA
VQVGPSSFLTLHYRVTFPDTGEDLVNTFADRPATVQLGCGQLAEPLEKCLLGLSDGDHKGFDLAPEQAFGERNPSMIQRVARQLLTEHADPDETFQPGDLVEFPAPGGGRYAGVLKELTPQHALLDFNHPLAGRRIRFEVKILGVL